MMFLLISLNFTLLLSFSTAFLVHQPFSHYTRSLGGEEVMTKSSITIKDTVKSARPVHQTGSESKYRGKTEFQTKVYDACYSIPRGKVATYKSLAAAIGAPQAFRAVGSALRNNPYAPEVPCHRVVASDLTLGGFQGSKNKEGEQLSRKKKLLLSEGVLFDQEKVSEQCCFVFSS